MPRPPFVRALVTALLCTLAAPPLIGTAAAQKPWERKGVRVKVKIDSSPQNAVIYLDSKEFGPLGYTPLETKLVKGTYKVILELPGYKPLARDITVGRRNDPFIFVMERLPKPAVLDLRVSPADDSAQGAKVTVDNVAVGAIPATVEVAAGRHQVVVTKDGYNTYSEWVDVGEAERRTVVIVMVRLAPKTGTLVVSADVPGVEVYVDGARCDGVPCVMTLPEGPHMVEVRSGTLQPFRQQVTVIAGQQAKVMASLASQIPQTGAIRVHTPGLKGAEVYVDGELKGKAPGEFTGIRPGTHALEVRAPGYKPFEKEIQIRAGDTSYVKVELEKLPEAKPVGLLVVKSTVPLAEVFIDGAAFGQAPVRRELPPGRYIVVVQKSGFPEFKREVMLVQGQTLEVVAEMKAVGRIMVMAPPGAAIILDGQLIARTPMTPTEVPTGEHILDVRHPGFLEFRQAIKVEGGKSANFEIELKPRPTGPSPIQVAKMRRALSSFGEHAIPPGTFTADVGFGFPYFFEGRMTVGAVRFGKMMGLDAGFIFRTFGQANEFLAKTRFTALEAGPIALGADFAIGGGGGPDGRDNFSLEFGFGFTLHFKEIAAFSGRGFLSYYTDRMCWPRKLNGTTYSNVDDLNSSRDVCRAYDGSTNNNVPNTKTVPPSVLDELTHFVSSAGLPADWDPRDHRLSGTRFYLQAALEVTVAQNVGLFLLIEGVPFQHDRAAFMDLWNSAQIRRDPHIYGRAGMTLKF
ncbi:MAG: PEGA domain-containing protein [Deltaproteobacteria bacterium]|nr:PEGA domain-containing protein [Deltaproteobacteria bacterium]